MPRGSEMARMKVAMVHCTECCLQVVHILGYTMLHAVMYPDPIKTQNGNRPHPDRTPR